MFSTSCSYTSLRVKTRRAREGGEAKFERLLRPFFMSPSRSPLRFTLVTSRFLKSLLKNARWRRIQPSATLEKFATRAFSFLLPILIREVSILKVSKILRL